MQRLAYHFAALPGLKSEVQLADLPTLKDQAGLPIPACANCHAPGKAGPTLAGQKPSYIAARLKNWQQDKKVVDARQSPATMPTIARRIPTSKIDALATTIGASPPAKQ